MRSLDFVLLISPAWVWYFCWELDTSMSLKSQIPLVLDFILLLLFFYVFLVPGPGFYGYPVEIDRFLPWIMAPATVWDGDLNSVTHNAICYGLWLVPWETDARVWVCHLIWSLWFGLLITSSKRALPTIAIVLAHLVLALFPSPPADPHWIPSIA